MACRLFPLGRQIQSNEVSYIHQGRNVSLFKTVCREVFEFTLFKCGVTTLKDKQTGKHEMAQDAYLELMQNLADIGFEFLLDYGLAESGDKKTLQLWREMGKEHPESLVKRIGEQNGMG